MIGEGRSIPSMFVSSSAIPGRTCLITYGPSQFGLNFLWEIGKLGAKPIDSPVEVHHRLSTEEGERILEHIIG